MSSPSINRAYKHNNGMNPECEDRHSDGLFRPRIRLLPVHPGLRPGAWDSFMQGNTMTAQSVKTGADAVFGDQSATA